MSRKEQVLLAVKEYVAAHYEAPTALHEPRAPYAVFPALRELDAGFSETVSLLVEEKYPKKADFLTKANLTKQLYHFMMQDPAYRPSRVTAFSCVIGLELPLEEAKDLLLRAGIAISHSSLFDVILEYFIANENYDIDLINQVLFEYDQPLLGSR